MKIRYYLIAVLLFTGILLGTPQPGAAKPATDELFPFLPKPVLSEDGLTLHNPSPPAVFVANHDPAVQGIIVPEENIIRHGMPSAVIGSTFSITYVAAGDSDRFGRACVAFPEEAKTAFAAAANIWAEQVRSSVPITIRACWANLGSPIVLGYSGGGDGARDFPNAPRAGTWYSASLANSYAGYDLSPDNQDMHITYNSGFDWYYGTEGTPPFGQFDLVTVAAHEIAHGLNFAGTAYIEAGKGYWGNGTGYPGIYDVFMQDGPGVPLTSYTNNSAALATLLTSDNLWFAGPNALAANGDARVKMYAPSTWISGSSYVHLDHTTFMYTANSMMVYAIPGGYTNHNPGNVTIGLIKDLGWNLTSDRFTISGNAGAAGVSLSYTDGTPQTVLTDAEGAYSFTVPFGWSGTVTPTLPGYRFSPLSREYVAVSSNQVKQHYTPTLLYTISGNTGVGAVTLNYTDEYVRTVISGADGSYSISVPTGWSGTVTPSKTSKFNEYVFTPVQRVYSNLEGDKGSQNYTVTILYTISGNAGAADVTISYTDGIAKNVISGADGTYAFNVSSGWSGTVTPTRTGFVFSPTKRVYTTVSAHQSGQDYLATGFVMISGNVGAPTVTMSYIDGTARTVISDVTGGYTITVPYGWSGQITPTKTGYTFSPLNRNYTSIVVDQSAQNYVANPITPTTTGVFRPSNGAIYLKKVNSSGFADAQLNYGIGGDYPVMGDWDGDGITTLGIYRDGAFYLRNSNTIGFADMVVYFGAPGDQPVAGDWNGDGSDTIGVYRQGVFFLRNSNSAGMPDMTFSLGVPGDIGIAGDWTYQGFDTTGVFRPSNGALYLKYANTTGFADLQINYGLAGDWPVIGDWDGNGTDTIGIFRGGTFMLRNSNTIGYADIYFGLGIGGDMPISGNWGLP